MGSTNSKSENCKYMIRKNELFLLRFCYNTINLYNYSKIVRL